jgi:hypothetical protein
MTKNALFFVAYDLVGVKLQKDGIIFYKVNKFNFLFQGGGVEVLSRLQEDFS